MSAGPVDCVTAALRLLEHERAAALVALAMAEGLTPPGRTRRHLVAHRARRFATLTNVTIELDRLLREDKWARLS